MDSGEHGDLMAATERWFVSQGLPHAIDDYSASQDVFTRSAPFLTFVFFVEVFFTFDDRFQGWSQAGVFILGIAILGGGLIVVNRLRGRAALQRPDEVGPLELGLFVFVPAILPILFSNDRISRPLGVVGFNLFILALAYLVTSYGLLPALRVGLRQVRQQFRSLTQLVARGLPLMLLFSVFVFLNAEMWQVAHDFQLGYYAIVVGALVGLAVGFVALRVPTEIDELGHFDDWTEVLAAVARTHSPLTGHGPRDGSRLPPRAELGRVDKINVGMLLIIGQVVQVTLIGLVIGIFYVGFGLLAVREDTIVQWTTASEVDTLARFGFLGSEIVVTRELLLVAGFIAAFSLLQFAVSMTTDSTVREELGAAVSREVRDVLAVRALYLDLRSG